MNRFATLSLFLFVAAHLSAQSIFWTTACSNQNFCLNPGSCAQGAVFLTEKAVTNCQSSQIVNYSYKLDLNDNGSIDIQSPEDTVTGNFAKGTHRVIWRASDNCGNAATCSYTFTIKDCQPPNLLCINGLTQTIDAPDCSAYFVASQFILNLSDNCTPTNQIEVGIRRTGSGTGFPTTDTITYGHCDGGTNLLEIVVRDGNGLTNQCNSYVIIQPGPGCTCNPDGDVTLQGCVRSAGNVKIDQYRLRILTESLPGAAQPVTKTTVKNISDSCYAQTISALPFGAGYRFTLRAERNDAPLDGVTTFDLLTMSKHILGIAPITNVYQHLAADVNKSGAVSTFDIVETRKVILNIYDTFPANTSWRFFRPMADPTNFNEVLRDTYQVLVPNLSGDITLSSFPFVGVKTGDANLSVGTFSGPAEDRHAGAPLTLTLPNRTLRAGELADISVSLIEMGKGLQGWQLALFADPDLVRIEGVEGLEEGNFSLSAEGVLRALWYVAGGFSSAQKNLFTLKIRALKETSLDEALHLLGELPRPEAYLEAAPGVPAECRALRLLVGDEASPASVAFFPPQPNPFSQGTRFGLSLPTDAAVQLAVFDPAGKQVFVETMSLEAGYQWVTLPGGALPEQGIYFYRLVAAGQVAAGKLVRQ